MKRFSFRFQQVLDLRYQREDQARRHLASVHRNYKRLEERIWTLKSNQQDGSDHEPMARIGRLGMDALRQQALLFLSQARQVQDWALELSALHTRLDAARAELNTAVAARRGLEHLRDQARLQWQRDQQRLERRATAFPSRRNGFSAPGCPSAHGAETNR